jgi:uncharacterized FAD-dependent dehydrogenase
LSKGRSCFFTIESFACCQVQIVRKSFDGRWKKTGEPKFVYTIDFKLSRGQIKKLGIKPTEGRIEVIEEKKETNKQQITTQQESLDTKRQDKQYEYVIVGSGPAGLFAALKLVAAGKKPIILERGKAEEARGRSIGALFNRKQLDSESNLCFGEGGAGTWSDGKLTTRIGNNSEEVREVLSLFVKFGAPVGLLIDGKPHLGTDRLVRILKAMRAFLIEKGVEFRFDSKVVDLTVEGDAPLNCYLFILFYLFYFILYIYLFYLFIYLFYLFIFLFICYYYYLFF